MTLPGRMPTVDHTEEGASPPEFQLGIPMISSGSLWFTATQGNSALLPKGLSGTRLREATKRDRVPTFKAPIVH